MRITERGNEILIDVRSYAPIGHDGDYVDWRTLSACSETDDHDIFFTTRTRYSRVHFKEALSYCHRCTVKDECYADAVEHGDHLVSVRGGNVPREKYEHTMIQRMKMTPFGDDMWKMFCDNVPSSIMRAASGVAEGTHSALMTNLLNDRLQGPENATWGAHKAPKGNAIGANAGWLISISADGRLYCIVVQNSRGQRTRCVRAREHVTLSHDVVTKNLPIMTNIPEAYQSN